MIEFHPNAIQLIDFGKGESVAIAVNYDHPFLLDTDERVSEANALWPKLRQPHHSRDLWKLGDSCWFRQWQAVA